MEILGLEEGAVVVMSLEYITTCFDPFENDGYEDLGVTDLVISPCLREVPLQSPPPQEEWGGNLRGWDWSWAYEIDKILAYSTWKLIVNFFLIQQLQD